MSFPVHYTTMYIASVQNKQNIDTASHLKLNSDSMSSIVTEYPYLRTNRQAASAQERALNF